MGTILYNGLFDPVYHETYLPPYQNFTVTVPLSFAADQAQIKVAHAPTYCSEWHWINIVGLYCADL
jgi:hypothetical protein